MDRIWTFKTARLEVFCEWEPEQDEDLSWADDDQETLDKLASEEWVNCTFRVGVMVNGELYADDYLGNSVRANPPTEFVTEHLGIAAWEREMGAKHGTTATACSYFREMVRSCLKETRKKLQREADRREEARAWLARYNAAFEYFPCRHGHLECSTVPGGRCLDETLHNYPEFAEG